MVSAVLISVPLRSWNWQTVYRAAWLFAACFWAGHIKDKSLVTVEFLIINHGGTTFLGKSVTLLIKPHLDRKCTFLTSSCLSAWSAVLPHTQSQLPSSILMMLMHCGSVKIWVIAAAWGPLWFVYNMNNCLCIRHAVIFSSSPPTGTILPYQGKVHSVGLIINPLFFLFSAFLSGGYIIYKFQHFSSLCQIKQFGDASNKKLVFITPLERKLHRFHFSEKKTFHYVAAFICTAQTTCWTHRTTSCNWDKCLVFWEWPRKDGESVWDISTTNAFSTHTPLSVFFLLLHSF